MEECTSLLPGQRKYYRKQSVLLTDCSSSHCQFCCRHRSLINFFYPPKNVSHLPKTHLPEIQNPKRKLCSQAQARARRRRSVGWPRTQRRMAQSCRFFEARTTRRCLSVPCVRLACHVASEPLQRCWRRRAAALVVTLLMRPRAARVLPALRRAFAARALRAATRLPPYPRPLPCCPA